MEWKFFHKFVYIYYTRLKKEDEYFVISLRNWKLVELPGAIKLQYPVHSEEDAPWEIRENKDVEEDEIKDVKEEDEEEV